MNSDPDILGVMIPDTLTGVGGGIIHDLLPGDTPSAAHSPVDELLTIPIFGFVDSFNISAACALLLSHFRGEPEKRSDKSWLMMPTQRRLLLLRWLRLTTAN